MSNEEKDVAKHIWLVGAMIVFFMAFSAAIGWSYGHLEGYREGSATAQEFHERGRIHGERLGYTAAKVWLDAYAEQVRKCNPYLRGDNEWSRHTEGVRKRFQEKIDAK